MSIKASKITFGGICETNGYIASYSYDNNGNQLTRTSTDSFGVTRYTYNKFNQQTEARINGTVAKYAYNAHGIRTSKVVGVTTTYYLLDGDNVIGEVQGGSVSVTSD